MNDTPELVFLRQLDVELHRNGAWDYVECMCPLNRQEAMNFLRDLSHSAYHHNDPIDKTATLFLNCVADAVGVN